MSILDIFTKSKDAVLSAVIRPILQSKIEPYGTMTTLNIDSKSRSINLSLNLKGEAAPIEFQIHEYEVVERDGMAFIRIGQIETSREWISQLIRDYLPEDRRTIPIPGSIAKAVKLVL